MNELIDLMKAYKYPVKFECYSDESGYLILLNSGFKIFHFYSLDGLKAFLKTKTK